MLIGVWVSMKNALILFKVEDPRGRMYWLYKGNECFWMVFWDGMESLVAPLPDVEAMFTQCSNPCLCNCYVTFFTTGGIDRQMICAKWDFLLDMETIGGRIRTTRHLQLHLEIVDNRNNKVTTTTKIN
jgi:hypothetical protein